MTGPAPFAAGAGIAVTASAAAGIIGMPIGAPPLKPPAATASTLSTPGIADQGLDDLVGGVVGSLVDGDLEYGLTAEPTNQRRWRVQREKLAVIDNANPI